MLQFIYKFIGPFSALFWIVASRVALAQAKCIVNGREVPCEEAVQSLKRFAGLGLGIFVILIVLFILVAVFWLMMLIHAATKPIPNKALWIIILLFTGILGAIVYYFAVKRKWKGQAMPPMQMQSR